MTADNADAAELDEPWPPAKSEDEWLLFYLRGLTFAQIARWCRVNAETVRYSIKQREAINPFIFGCRLMVHDRPRWEPPKVGRDRAWDKRYAAVFRFVASEGRLPKQLGGPAEKAMQRWLYNQRLKLAAEDLDRRQVELLNVLGEWRGQ